MANTIVWNKYDYVQKMRARINKPTCWADVLNVKYSDVRAIVNGAISVEPAVVAGTRGTAYAYNDFTIAADTLTISNTKMIAMFIDEADRLQQSYVDQMSVADFQGKKISEKIEALMLGEYASWTDFGATDLVNGTADDTTQITVSATNIDDMVRAIKRKLNYNNGIDFAVEKGYFIVWRASDFELLEGFVMANGFVEADIALKNGIPVQKAFHYMGVDHYLSTQHTAGHVFAGIKGMGDLGILRGTFGKTKFIEDPPASVTTAAPKSGLGIVSRLDYAFNWPTYNAQFFMDVNVAGSDT